MRKREDGPEMDKIYQGDCLSIMRGWPSDFIHCCVTSPPYFGLRDYGVPGQLGLEKTPQEYVDKMVSVFREVRRVLRDDGTLWLNLGDSYAAGGLGQGSGKQRTNHGSCNGQHIEKARKAPDGLKPKDLCGIPWRVALALQADGWYLRSDIIWSKPNPMPESVTDRPTRAHEYIFLLAKSERYYYDAEAIKEPGIAKNEHDATGPGWWAPGQTPQTGNRQHKTDKQRGHGRRHDGFNDRWDAMTKTEQCSRLRNKRDVWTEAVAPYQEAHFATFPPDLIKPCILAGTSEHGVCAECGAPYERIVERTAGTSTECPKTQAAHIARGGTGKLTGTVGKSGGGRQNGFTMTAGWLPSCKCGVSPARPIVFDPFMGAGTTALVSAHYGRHFLGCELNPAYIEMAERRIECELKQEKLL